MVSKVSRRWSLYVGGNRGRSPTPKPSPRSQGTLYVECPSCHRLTPIGTGYCRHCGAPLSPVSSYTTVPTSYRWNIPLGVDAAGNPAGIRLVDLQGHLVVYGVVGAGKTTLVKQILYEIAQLHSNVHFTILDWEGEYWDLAQATGTRILTTSPEPEKEQHLRISLLNPGNTPPNTYTSWLTSLLIQAMREEGWDVTSQMEALLRRALSIAVARKTSLNGLVDIIWRLSSKLPQGHQTAAALEARLSRFTEGTLSTVLSDPDTTWNLLETSTIIDISSIARVSPPDARLLAKILIARLFYQASSQPSSGKLRLLLVVEEAEEIAPNKSHNEILGLSTAMMHLRKRGIGVIVVAHSPTLLNPSIPRIASSIAVFSLRNPEDVKAAAQSLSIDQQTMAAAIQGLRRGECIIRPASSPRPFLLKTMRPVANIDDKAQKLLQSLYTHPHLSTRERRAYLGMNGEEYRQAVEHLRSKGLVRVVTVYQGRGRPVTLLQPKGMNPSIAHRYTVYHAARMAEKLPWIEHVDTNGNEADIKAKTINGNQIAIEIETGTNINTGKYLNLIEQGYCCIIIVCTTIECRVYAKKTVEKLGEKRIAVASLTTLPHILRQLVNPTKKPTKTPT